MIQPYDEYRRSAGETSESVAAAELKARERGVAADRAQDHQQLPVVSYAQPPVPALQLAGVSTKAAQDLRH